MLEGKHVRLRQIEEVDLSKLRDWRNAPHIRAYTREYRPLNMLNQNGWLSSLLTTLINWKEGHGEVSIYIGEEKWQEKGYATDALQILLKYCFCELRLHRIYAIIFEYNESSTKFFERNGFKFEGRHREARFWDAKFHDELVYGILDYEYFGKPAGSKNC
jgi:RimJ/RimL family protein N-acetyltransferase